MHLRKRVLPVLYFCFLLVSTFSLLGLNVWQIKPVYATESTFGKTSIGGSSDAFGEEILLVCKFTSPADFGTATKISVYTKAASGTISAIVVIYADSSGSPAARLAESSEVTGIGETAAWTNFTISYAGSPNTVYWLGIHGSDNFLVYYDAGTSHQVRYLYPHNYPTNSNPFYLDEGWWLSWSASIYAVYTASTGISASDISSNTTIAGEVCNFSAYWTSVSGTCDFYIFGTNNTGTWTNETAEAFSPVASTAWSNITKTLNTTVGVRVEWRIWANNTAATWGNIALQYVVTTNQISVSTIGRTTSLAGTSCKFYAYWITVSGTLDSYIFGTNNTGVWVNETKADFAGTPTEDWSNITKTLNDTAGYVVQWEIWANNTGGAEVNTGLQSFTLTTWASEKYTVYAATGYRQDIQIAINDVRSNGDNPPEREGVVIVPGGNWTLDATGGIGGSTALYAIDTIYWYVHSYGGIDIIGNGKYDTNLTLLPNEATYPAVSMFFVDGSNQKPFTISGISFYGRTGAAASATGDTGILIDSAKDFRVCHSSFDFMGSGGVASTGSIVSLTTRGVIDHCNFTRIYKEDAVTAGTGYGYGVALDRSYQKGGGMQDILWDQYGTPSQFLGSYGNVTYVEDNYFQGCRHAICAYASAAYVSRYNTFTEMWVPYSSGYNDIHGAYPDNVYGGRYIEVYNNTFYNPPGKNPYGSDEDAMATKNRGGGGVVFNNYIWNLTYAFSIAADDGNNAHPKCKVSNLYFWSNTLVGTTQFSLGENYDNRVLGVDYFTNAPTSFTYVAYEYPHPLTQTEEGIIVMLLNPNSTIYYSSTIPVQISAQGGTIDKIWWNCKNSTSWIYGSNQTYTVTTSMTGFVNGTSYTFYAWANNTLGVTAEKTQVFSVQIIPVILTVTSPLSQQYASGSIWVQLSATGGAIDEIWWNCKNGTSWIYTNQTYVTLIQMTGFSIGSDYTFYAWANNTDGQADAKTVAFTVTAYTVDITINSPTNTTYTTSTILVSFTASGGTVDDQWFNIQNGTTWIYGSNQSYTSPTNMLGFVNGTSYLFCAWANNTLGYEGNATIMFSVGIYVVIPPETPDYIAVELNGPSDGYSTTSTVIIFTYTPYTTSTFENASLYLNVSGTWQSAGLNTTAILNNTANSWTYMFLTYGTFTWNIQVYNTTDYAFANANFTITLTAPTLPPSTGNVFYFCPDTQTINTVTGYKLSETPPNSNASASISASGNVTGYVAYRVFIVYDDGTMFELSSGYIAITGRTNDTEGLINATWACPRTSLNVGFQALRVEMYMQIGSGGWIDKATFITGFLNETEITASTWIFQTYTKHAYTGGSTIMTATWGTSIANSLIDNVGVTDPGIYDLLVYQLNMGNFVGFIFMPYTNLVGNLFYGLLLLVFFVPLYNRYKSFSPIIILLILFGGAGGILSLMVPEAGLGISWIFLIVGIGGLIYKVFR